YGPPPPLAEALLAVASLRAECVRAGVREVAVTPNRTGPGNVARLAPLALRTSAVLRLRRLARDAVYKEDLGQLVVPLKRPSGGERTDAAADVPSTLRDLLAELVPVEEGALAS
ncbi:MAG: hypothetical protein H0U89_10370, partial [Acidimicrobiia bacterium]|nr:hypothetical protein [Acidimicrobiia bacterium]